MNDQPQLRPLEEIQADVTAAETKHNEAAEILNKAREEWEKFRDEFTHTRTAGFDQAVLDEAHEWGVNPHNFDTQALLEDAIYIAKETRTKVEPEVAQVESDIQGA